MDGINEVAEQRLHEIKETWSTKQANLMNKRGNLTFENPRQRSYVWERWRMSELIDTILRGYPIPAFYTRKVNGVYDFLDGKQRMSAICNFLNGNYALSVLEPFSYEDDETGDIVTADITGKKFSELPTEMQDVIKDYPLDVRYFEGINDEQVTTMFKKLNNGKPLSAKDKNIANAIDLKHLMEIGENPMFSLIYTQNALNDKKHITAIMKVWCMLNQPLESVTFESKVFNDLMANTIITQEQGEELNRVFDMFFEVYNMIGNIMDDPKQAKALRKKLGGELHFVSFAWFIRKALQDGVDDEQLTRFFCYFYGVDGNRKVKSISDVYNQASQSSTAKNVNIRRRHYELLKAWNEFFNVEGAQTYDVDEIPNQMTF